MIQKTTIYTLSRVDMSYDAYYTQERDAYMDDLVPAMGHWVIPISIF